jgi:multidrug efflux pump subunit AcrA (membrane-fusion protein)
VVNGVARSRQVRLGAQGDARVEVLEGLEEGERLVARGADRVRDGQRLP